MEYYEKREYIPMVDDLPDNQLKGPFVKKSKDTIYLDFGDELKTAFPEPYRIIKIERVAYVGQIDIIVKYMNYFVKYFDDENALMVAYMQMCLVIKKRNSTLGESPEYPLESFKFAIDAIMLDDYFTERIVSMVEHNKIPPIKTTKKTTESIQIQEDIYCALMAVAIMTKMIIPILSLYYKERRSEIRIDGIEDVNDDNQANQINLMQLILSVTRQLVDRFNEVYDVDVQEKLYYIAGCRITKTYSTERKRWERRESYGSTTSIFQSEITDNVFTNLLHKAVFEKPIVGLLHDALDKYIKHHLEHQDKADMQLIDFNVSDGDDDPPTQFDIIQNSHAKYNIINRNRIKFIIDKTIVSLCKEYDVEIRDKDINFYVKNYKLKDDKGVLPVTQLQTNLILLFLSKYCKQDISKEITPMQFLQSMILFKYVYRFSGYEYLPLIVSASVDRMSSVKRFNKSTLEKLIEDHPLYPELVEDYTDIEGQVNKKALIESLRELVTSSKLYVIDHDYPEAIENNTCMTGEVSGGGKGIYERLADELVRFVKGL
jgi:hypothetical protein